MKANALLVLSVTALALAGCASQPRPAPGPPVLAPPRPPLPRPSAPLPAPSPPPADWRDAPRTPGDWRWSNAGGRSLASYGPAGAPVLTLACDGPGRTVTLFRSWAAPQAGPLTITATSARRMFTASAISAPSGVAVTLPATDPILDAMAFSRGRFMVETAGMPTLYLPSWPEVSRVIEDCR